MRMSHKYDLIEFALQYTIPPSEAYVLRALFERSAELVNISYNDLLSKCETNSKLGLYMAECAHKLYLLDKVAA